jgi:hypothetical protein
MVGGTIKRFLIMCKHYRINPTFLLRVLLMSAGIFCFHIASAQFSDDVDTYRFNVALKLFPRIAATDEDLTEKLTSSGEILLLIYYKTDRESARQLKGILADNIPRIGKRKIVYQYTSDLEKYSDPRELPAAIFLAEPLTKPELQTIMRYAQRYQRLVFSPFEGDVERGVTAGIYISNKITPYFNMQALSRSNVALNQGLLRVSTQYE